MEIKDLNNIISIGGESYNYLFFNEKIINGKFYTNSEVILKDFYYNKNIYNKNLKGELIDYNKCKMKLDGEVCILNLSKLNVNLMKNINNSKIKKIIIINCHHNDFWKKIKYLDNYKLVKRQIYVDEKIGYFISVNIFKL